jgi:serine/threonine-protein kinase
MRVLERQLNGVNSMPDALERLRSALAVRYAVERQLGEGGMATVYLAHDERHDRNVALKLLKPELAAAVGATRFLTEIRTTAKLQHPNILPLFDSGNAAGDDSGGDDLLFYVMPFVEGESLRQRLEREGALPVREAVRITIAVADALAYAHRQGVIHRDIKPENILLHEQQPLVADFGIAVAANRSAGERLTQTGLLIGTPVYMSPEQAGGDVRVDQRSDVYALGCVAYEMLAGEPPHSGRTPQAIIARSLTTHPRPLRDLRPVVPEHIDAAVRTALQAHPSDRFQDATAFVAALTDTTYRLPGEEARRTERRRRLLWGAAWAASVIGAVWLPSVMRGGPVGDAPDAPPVSRFVHVLPPDQSFTGGSHSLVAVSPDGSSFVYVANDGLRLRNMATLLATPIRGTEGDPRSPFFSPDGESVAYWDAAAEELRRVPVSGGAPVPLTNATTLYGASWSEDGTIVYGQPDGIWRIAGNGGVAERIVANEPTALAYGPRMLPGGTALLFAVVARNSMIGQSTAWDSAAVVVQDLGTGERTEIVRGGDAHYVPTGHLVYAVDTVLFAVPFDVRTRQRRGSPAAVVEGVRRTVRGSAGQAGGANYAFSREGTLVYVPVDADVAYLQRRRLVAVDRQGNTELLVDGERNYWRPRISPDGRRVALEVTPEGQGAEVWMADLERRTMSPFARDGPSAYPLWTPDGRYVLYGSTRDGRRGIFRQAADGSGDAELFLEDARADDVSPDGVLAFTTLDLGSSVTIRTLRLGSDSASDYLTTRSRAVMAKFSPDGNWLAYTSSESGQQEIYVKPFPRAPGVAQLVSADGGTAPVWAPDGSELYYQGATGFIMAVSTTLTPTFSAGTPEPLFRYADRFVMSGTGTAYDVQPDGTRFIMVQEPETLPARSSQVHVVRNWFEELSRVR